MKVGLLDAEEVELALCAVEQASPEEAAGTDADLRLQDVVPGTQGV